MDGQRCKMFRRATGKHTERERERKEGGRKERKERENELKRSSGDKNIIITIKQSTLMFWATIRITRDNPTLQ